MCLTAVLSVQCNKNNKITKIAASSRQTFLVWLKFESGEGAVWMVVFVNFFCLCMVAGIQEYSVHTISLIVLYKNQQPINWDEQIRHKVYFSSIL